MSHAWVFPLPPVTTNGLYATVGNRRKLVPSAERWKQMVVAECRQPYRELPGGPLAVEICVRFPPDNRRRDLDNLLKITLDAIAAAHEIDDSAFWSVHIDRITAFPLGTPCLYVRIHSITALRPKNWWLKIHAGRVASEFLRGDFHA